MASLAKILRRSTTSQEIVSEDREPSPLAVRATRLALWVLVAVGALGGAVGAIRSAPPAVLPPPVAAPEGVPPDVIGRAEVAVRNWLTTGELSPSPEPPDDTDQTPRMAVLWASAVGSRSVERNYWAVTVAADVRAPEDETPVRWLLEVGVLRSGGVATVVGPPAVVSDAPSHEVDLRGTQETPQRDDPIATTAESFLRSLLTGAGEVGRYMAPGASVPPLTPAPFESVTVERIGIVGADQTTSTIRVEASAITAAEVEVSLSYELSMAERDGRWEVQGLSGAPTLRRDGRPEPGESGAEPDGHGTRARREPAPDPSTTNPPTPGA